MAHHTAGILPGVRQGLRLGLAELGAAMICLFHLTTPAPSMLLPDGSRDASGPMKHPQQVRLELLGFW